METNTHNIYLFKALDAYPFNLEETIESLNYALSYDPNDAQALLLMARLYAFQLKDYESAKHYFEAAMTAQMEMTQLYPDYVFTLLLNEDYPEAQRLLEYATQLKGTDKAVLQLLQGQLYEGIFEYKRAVTSLKEARKLAKNNHFMGFVKQEIERVKGKLPKKNKKKSKKAKNNKRKEKKKNRSRRK
ncbi:MAG: hypothetical protein AAFP76_01055 [Bacteroidota bacterium]